MACLRGKIIRYMRQLQVQNLTLTLNGKHILHNLTVDFWKGHIHAVVGPNGAGKSTFAYTVMGLAGYRDFQGEILFNGESIKSLKIDERARRGMTLAWQEPARFEGLTVETFIKAAAKDKSDKHVNHVLDMMGLDPESYAKRAVDKTLSGGERKKVELASIMAAEPSFVLLDEPDSGIDVASLENIFAALKILQQQGATVILITHSLTVLNQADHAFLLCGGKIVDQGSTEKIKGYFQKRCLPCHHENNPSEFIQEVEA